MEFHPDSQLKREISMEEASESELFEISTPISVTPSPIRDDGASSVFSLDLPNSPESLFTLDPRRSPSSLYVAVGADDSSMDALEWALKHAVTSSTLVCLIHVFPELRSIPTPLGMLPKSQVNPQQVGSYVAQERSQRKKLLEKYIYKCSASKVNVDAILIQSDIVEKGILDLIPVLDIRRLVIGTNKSNLKKLNSKKGNSIADHILQNAPIYCDVKVICEGKEVIDKMMGTPSQWSSDDSNSRSLQQQKQEQEQQKESEPTPACTCFSSLFLRKMPMLGRHR